jgi:hypothetical protein
MIRYQCDCGETVNHFDVCHNDICTGGKLVLPKYGFTVKFLNKIDFRDLTSDQCTRILTIILEENTNVGSM